MMKFVTLIVALTAFLSGNGPKAFAIAEGDTFPNIKIASVESDVLDPTKLAGKVTIINFWATWCDACKVELVEMQEKFADLLTNNRFQFAFVSLDKDPEEAKTWVRTHLKDGEKYLKYLFKDPSFSAADELEVDSFPMTLVIDQQGKVVKIHRGFKPGEGSTEAMAQLASSLLAE